jgi:hypothetical protein
MVSLYRVTRNIVSWVVLAVIAAIVGEFAIDLAREHGVFDSPTQRVEAVMNFLKSQPWFWPCVTGLAGCVAGMWIDSFVRGREAASTGTSDTHASTTADYAGYAYGLALMAIQPALDPNNAGNTFELRTVIRNAAALPLRYEIEKYEVTFEAVVTKCAIGPAVMPKDGILTLIPNRGLSRKQYADLPQRTTGTLEYQIKYGHPDRALSRRAYKLIQIDLFKKKDTVHINWLIRNESDEAV